MPGTLNDTVINGLAIVAVIIIVGVCFFLAGVHTEKVSREIKDIKRKSNEV